MLSGNRNFEARIHPGEGELPRLSPARRRLRAGRADGLDLTTEPLGQGSDGEDVFLSDIWPSTEEIKRDRGGRVQGDMFRRTYADVFKGDERWSSLEIPEGDLYDWREDSTYVRRPPYFDGMSPEPGTVDDIHGARCLVQVGDSVTTDTSRRPARSSRTAPPGST